ncbi:MAG: hypothetical protein GX974_02880, partial [Clostridiales bacterium]|nr:hypothetical protein [Clostridiales bacterium]
MGTDNTDIVSIRKFSGNENDCFDDGVLIVLKGIGKALIRAEVDGEKYYCPVISRKMRRAKPNDKMNYYIGDFHPHTTSNHGKKTFSKEEKNLALKCLKQVELDEKDAYHLGRKKLYKEGWIKRNMEKFACIPHSFLIVVDDVGWWCGDDYRYKNGPSRSGMSRRHCIEDYKVLIEIGRSLNMRIKCGFVVGEWDRTNILAKVRNSNKHGSKWDNASRLDSSIDEVRDIINANQDYMELALHGLMHMYWTDDGIMEHAEFYQHSDIEDNYKMTPPDIIREHIDAYFEILEQNGLPTDIESFIPPCFNYVYSQGQDQISSILAEYGIKYVSTPFNSMQFTTDEKPIDVGVENGIITVDRTPDWTDWDDIGSNTPREIKKSYYGAHWVNFLNSDPKDNMDVAKRWIDYFARYKEKFDILPAKDNAMGSAQALYKRFTKVD